MSKEKLLERLKDSGTINDRYINDNDIGSDLSEVEYYVDTE